LANTESLTGFWKNLSSQNGWEGILTNSSPSLLEELEIDLIIDQGSFWMNMMSKSLCAFKIVLVSKLFLW